MTGWGLVEYESRYWVRYLLVNYSSRTASTETLRFRTSLDDTWTHLIVSYVDNDWDRSPRTGPDGKARGPLRRRGHAKNRRYDAPLVTVGLAVTREGLPVLSARPINRKTRKPSNICG
jgi:hypothetical protein